MASAARAFLSAGRKIVCVGRNYGCVCVCVCVLQCPQEGAAILHSALPGRLHAKEMGEALPKEPLLFLKPTTSYLPMGKTLQVRPSLSLSPSLPLSLSVSGG